MAELFEELCNRVMSKADRDRADERAREIMAALGLSEKHLPDKLSQKEPETNHVEQPPETRRPT